MFLTHSTAEMVKHQQWNCSGWEDAVKMVADLYAERVNDAGHRQELAILPQCTWTLSWQPKLVVWAYIHHLVTITVSWSEEVGLMFLK